MRKHPHILLLTVSNLESDSYLYHAHCRMQLHVVMVGAHVQNVGLGESISPGRGPAIRPDKRTPGPTILGRLDGGPIILRQRFVRSRRGEQ